MPTLGLFGGAHALSLWGFQRKVRLNYFYNANNLLQINHSLTPHDVRKQAGELRGPAYTVTANNAARKIHALFINSFPLPFILNE